MGSDGIYGTVSCEKFMHDEQSEETLGCYIDPEFMIENQLNSNCLRIKGPDGKIYQTMADPNLEKCTPLIVENVVASQEGSSIEVRWGTNWSHSVVFSDF